MPYELAKQLKDAGFPQKQNPRYETWNGNEHGEPCTVPTLEELIEACGSEQFGALYNGSDGTWLAETHMFDDTGITKAEGKTPKEAVARLWLALNKKESGIV